MSYSEAQLVQAVDAVFAKYDADGNNYLDANEVYNLINDALSHMKSSRKVSQQEVTQFIAAVDKSGDGKIQKTELYEIFKKVLAWLIIPSWIISQLIYHALFTSNGHSNTILGCCSWWDETLSRKEPVLHIEKTLNWKLFVKRCWTYEAKSAYKLRT